jgi:hypothetical protein
MLKSLYCYWRRDIRLTLNRASVNVIPDTGIAPQPTLYACITVGVSHGDYHILNLAKKI